MGHYENLIAYIDELNAEGRIQYEDYSKLFDLASELYGLEEVFEAIHTDIAALLWLNGNCEYCRHGLKEEFSGANRWTCALGSGVDCRPEWRGATLPVNANVKAPEPVQMAPKHEATAPQAGVDASTPTANPRKTYKPVAYKGFLFIKCHGCGKIHGFCAKAPISNYRCVDCGCLTPLNDIVPMYVRCKCGQRFRYQTNLTDDCFTYTCFGCGAPVDMAYNKKGRKYQTV